jgi:hypothetical protein
MSCGRNSAIGISTSQPASLVQQIDAGKHSIEPLFGGEAVALFGERPCILVQGDDMHVEVEPARTHEPKHSIERGPNTTGFDPRDERLRCARPSRQLTLGQPGAQPRLSDELSGINLPTISDRTSV